MYNELMMHAEKFEEYERSLRVWNRYISWLLWYLHSYFVNNFFSDMRHSVYISLCISDDNLQVLSFASKIGTILSWLKDNDVLVGTVDESDLILENLML